ncbi:MAG: flagellar biosynthesis anti-sigma factor FlgM [Candidatus Riflebacteria bacterium]|nr:flagellar biosynthesis anti-sigma factor FlgM [Candidatus Riflebacteria bacterium]
MKVSNGNSIQKIYREQVNKAKPEASGDDFSKLMKSTAKTTDESVKTAFHPPSGVSAGNPLFTGKPVKEADLVETMKFAAEVVASQPDIRSEKVDHLAALIKSGQYNVPAEAVANRLFTSGIVTNSWEA